MKGNDKHKTQGRLLLRLTIGALGVASSAYGLNGILRRHITSGDGSLAKAPWGLAGEEAMIMGALFSVLGVYLIYVALAAKASS